MPFAVGQAAWPWICDWLARHRLLISVVDRGSILLVVYAAFSAGMVAEIWTQLSIADLAIVGALDALTLGLVIGTTVAVSAICASRSRTRLPSCLRLQEEHGGGIPMATILFPGHAVGLIVLPLMIFHQVQLLVCAFLARRYA